MERILLVRTHAIGDVLLTTPAVKAARKIYPDAKIDYLTTKWSKEAITLNPNIDEIIAVDDDVFFSKNPTKIIKLVKELKKRNYDRIYAFHRSKKIHLLCKLIGNKVTGISDGDFNPFLDEKIVLKRENSNYVADDYLKMFNIEIENSSLEFYWSKEDEIFIDNLIGDLRFVCVAPGGAHNPAESVWQKLWKVENFIKVIKYLKNRKEKVIIVGGKSDEKICKEIEEKCEILNLCGKLTLKHLGVLLKRSKFLLTNDSAPLHIAVAVNTPVIGLFGPTSPDVLLPKRENIIAIRSDAECSPCYVNRRFKGCKKPICMDMITTDKVISVIEKKFY